MDFSNVKSGEIVEMEEESVIIRIPENTIFIEMNATVVDENGNTRILKRNFTFSDVQKAREYFKENVEDEEYDAVYALTEEGLEYYNSLQKEKE